MHMIDMSHNEGSHSLINPLVPSSTLPFGSSTVDPMLGDDAYNPWKRLEHKIFYNKQLRKFPDSN